MAPKAPRTSVAAALRSERRDAPLQQDHSSQRARVHAATARPQPRVAFHVTAESSDAEGNDTASDEEGDAQIRQRVRQQIHARVQQLRRRDSMTSESNGDITVHSLESLAAAAGGGVVAVAAELDSVHGDVVKTAADILGRYLARESTPAHASLELTLVHRMLVKESELHALHAERSRR